MSPEGGGGAGRVSVKPDRKKKENAVLEKERN